MMKHTPMDPAERAKQFMPFAALKGLPEALRAVEEEVESEAENPDKISFINEIPCATIDSDYLSGD